MIQWPDHSMIQFRRNHGLQSRNPGQVPLFALLDDEETAVLASQVEVKTFAPRQRIYKIGDPGGQAYVWSPAECA